MRDEQESLGGIRPSAITDVMHSDDFVTVDLRILATTDIHMQLLGYDYARDRALPHAGLAGLATLIGTARSEARAQGMACLLLDNGDLLQGAALEHVMLNTPVTPDHPLVACLNQLEYDGYGVGNHDLDHGLDYLRAVADHLNAPMISSNLRLKDPCAILPSAVISLPTIKDATGTSHGLTVGLVSALPEKTSQWNARELAGQGHIDPILASTEAAVRDVRKHGADVVILLAHLGVEGAQQDEQTIDDARSLADIAGVDAIILGHTHRRLPGHDHAGCDRVDTLSGALGQRPSVMAGFDASDLAVIDLHLSRRKGAAWQVSRHASTLRPNTPNVPADPAIERLCAPAHAETRAALSTTCGRIGRPLHNFFSLAAPTTPNALMANAKWLAIKEGLRGRAQQDLPLLAMASAHTAGGRGGPTHFLHVPKGPILARHMDALSPYANGIWALKVTGAELREWLENAASVYTRLRAGVPDQPLLQDTRPAFDFDTIYGLDYCIDPTQPSGARISQLAYMGRAVTPDQRFVLATNNFRAAGGGGGRTFGENRVICRSTMPMTTALSQVLDWKSPVFALDTQPWKFKPALDVTAILPTAPEALRYLSEIAHLAPVSLGTDPLGFARIRLSL